MNAITRITWHQFAGLVKKVGEVVAVTFVPIVGIGAVVFVCLLIFFGLRAVIEADAKRREWREAYHMTYVFNKAYVHAYHECYDLDHVVGKYWRNPFPEAAEWLAEYDRQYKSYRCSYFPTPSIKVVQ